MENQNNNQAVMTALGYPIALPQTLVPVTTSQTQIQRTQYDPNKLKAVIAALQKPRNAQMVADAIKKPRTLKTRGEVIAEVLADIPEARSFTGGFGEEIINPWGMALTSFARGFGSAYKSKKADEREKADAAREDAIKSAQVMFEAENAAREDAIKAAQLDLEANKAQITSQTANEYMKVNDPKALTPEQIQKEEVQKQAALSALHTLDDLAQNGNIYALNKSPDNWGLSAESSRNIGRREQALSTLVPMTAKVAHDAGISGINSVGEAMLYLGIPANATSAQIKGMLPGVIKKLGLEKEYYQMSPIEDGLAF